MIKTHAIQQTEYIVDGQPVYHLHRLLVIDGRVGMNFEAEYFDLERCEKEALKLSEQYQCNIVKGCYTLSTECVA